MKLILTIPALERLIGGDSEVEVELRKQIVLEFAKRHLGAVANEMHAELTKTKAEVFAQVLRDMGVNKATQWGSSTITITSEVKEVIKNVVRDQLHAEIRTIARALWSEMEVPTKEGLKTFYDRELLILVREQAREDLLKSLKK